MWGGADNVWSIRYAEHGYRLTCQIAKQHIQNAYHKLNSEKCALPSVTQLETQLSRTSWHDTSTCRVRTYGLLLPHSLVHVNLELSAFILVPPYTSATILHCWHAAYMACVYDEKC